MSLGRESTQDDLSITARGRGNDPSAAFDVIVAADFTTAGDLGLRIAGECAVQSAMGLRTGLLHLGQGGNGRRMPPDIQRIVRQRLAEPVDLSQPVQAVLIVVHAPAVLGKLPAELRNLRAGRIVLVHDRRPKVEAVARMSGLMLGRMSWAPANRWVRAALENLQLPLVLEEMDWRPPLVVSPARPAPHLAARRLTIGHVSGGTRGSWPANWESLLELLPTDGSVDVRLLGHPPASLLPDKTLPPAWTVDEPADISLDAFLDSIDALVLFPGAKAATLPDAAVCAAMMKRRLVLTSPRFSPHFGAGPIYCEAGDAAVSAVNALRGPSREEVLDRAVEETTQRFTGQFHAERIARLTRRDLDRKPQPRVARSRPPRALFVASNGVGLGHVTRLLAIANRAGGRFEPVFATHAQTVPQILSFGYAVEYLPSLSDTGADPAAWDRWLRLELERLIYFYDVDALVFDGNNPTPGLVRAALSQPPCRLVWVRRGMNGPVASPHLGNARYFDLILEPGEIAQERDTGATAARRHEVVQVDPVTLLDADHLLDRKAAAEALGLDPARPAVLVQLGAGAHRDIVSLVDEVVTALRDFDGLQIVLAEWTNSTAPLSLWPDTVVVAGFPLSRYLRAFDFAISAAGYNTFHEATAFAIPTVFIAARHAAIDDQRARAQYAQDMGAALDLPEDQLFQLPAICSVMLDERAREVMREKCRAIAMPNGAAAAAAAIGDLLGAT